MPFFDSSAIPFLLVLLMTTATNTVVCDGQSSSLAPPPGCQCTMAECCNATLRQTFLDCGLLELHVPLMTSGISGIDSVCQLYLNGTLDANTTVCNAILADAKFQDRFVTSVKPYAGSTTRSSSSEWSLWSAMTPGASCRDNDLTSEACPVKPNTTTSLVTSQSWTSLQYGKCGTASIGPIGNDTVKLVQQEECTEDDGGVLNIYQGAVPAFVDLETCPTQTTLVFSDTTANGVDQQRWMCQEYTATVAGISTTIRHVYVNLGPLPCQLQTPSPTTSVPTTNPTTISGTSMTIFTGMHSGLIYAMTYALWLL